jgi:hypothetical protein
MPTLPLGRNPLPYRVDEHVARAVAPGLRRRGIEAVPGAEGRRLGAEEEDLLAFADEDGRVIVTRGGAASLAVYVVHYTRVVIPNTGGIGEAELGYLESRAIVSRRCAGLSGHFRSTSATAL